MSGRAQLWSILLVLLVLLVWGDVLGCYSSRLERPDDGKGRFLGLVSAQAKRQSRSPDDSSRPRRDSSKGCGETITASAGFVRSPGFPNSYEPGLLCTWNIHVPAHKLILLRFIVLDVRGGSSGRCTAGEDYVMIRNGSGSGQHLGIFCSPSSEATTPSPILSITNQVAVIFHSNRRHTGKGFLMSFVSVNTLGFSDYIAQQITFEPTVSVDMDEQTDLTSPNVITQEGNTLSSLPRFLAASLPTDATVVNGQDSEYATSNSRNLDILISEFMAGNVHYSDPGELPINQGISTSPRDQTASQLTSQEATENEPLASGIPVDDDYWKAVTEKPNLTTLLGPFNSKSQPKDELLTAQPQISAGDILDAKSRNTQIKSVSQQPLATKTERQVVSQTEQQAEMVTQLLETASKHQSAEQKLNSVTEQFERRPTEQQVVTQSEQQAEMVTQILETSSKNPLTSLDEQEHHRVTQQFEILTEQQAVTQTEQQAEMVTQLLETASKHQSAEQKLDSVTEQFERRPTEQQVVTQSEQQVVTQSEQQAATQTEQQAEMVTQLLETSSKHPLTSLDEQEHHRVTQQFETLTEQQAEMVTQLLEAISKLQSTSLSEKKLHGITHQEQQAVTQPEHQTEMFTQILETPSNHQSTPLAEQKLHRVTQQEQQAVTQTEQQAEMVTQILETPSNHQSTPLAEQNLRGVTQQEQKAVTQPEQQAEMVTQLLETISKHQSTSLAEQKLHVGTQQFEILTEEQAVTQPEQQTEIVTQLLETPSNHQSTSLTEQKLHRVTQQEQQAVTQTEQQAEMVTQLLETISKHQSTSLAEQKLHVGTQQFEILTEQQAVTQPEQQTEIVTQLLETPSNHQSTSLTEQKLHRVTQQEQQAVTQTEQQAEMVTQLLETPSKHQSTSLAEQKLHVGTQQFGILTAQQAVTQPEQQTQIVTQLLETPSKHQSTSLTEQKLHRVTQQEQQAVTQTEQQAEMVTQLLETPNKHQSTSLAEQKLHVGTQQFGILTAQQAVTQPEQQTEIVTQLLETPSNHQSTSLTEQKLHRVTQQEQQAVTQTEQQAEMVTQLLKTPSKHQSTPLAEQKLHHGTQQFERLTEQQFITQTRQEKFTQIDQDIRRLPSTGEPWDFSGNLNNPSGKLQSPNYPEAYPIGVRYKWNITVSSRGIIFLNFTHFDMDSYSSEDGQCDERYAHVKVYDENINENRLFCGQEIPPALVTSSNTLIVTFISGYGYGTGFHAQYMMQKIDDRIAIPGDLATQPVCGGSYYQPSGEIFSPNFPEGLVTGVHCLWNITVDVGQIVVINFTDFNLGFVPIGSWCSERNGYVKILDGDGDGGRNYTYCGQKVPPVFTSSTNTALISFVSEYAYRGGFHAQYWVFKASLKSTPEVPLLPAFATTLPSFPCGGILRNCSGFIQSPRVPEDSAASAGCQWDIIVSTGQVIALNFTDFDLDSMPIDNWCSERYDHVKITDGSVGKLSIYCGNELPPAFSSSGSTLSITYVSLYGYSEGFRAHYTCVQMDDGKRLAGPRFQTTPPQPVASEQSYVCGGNLNEPVGAIQSPESPGVNCRWNITVDPGWVIVLNFTTFDLDSFSVEDLCDERYAHIKVGDGDNSSYVFCGQERPPDVFSSTRTLIINYFGAYGINNSFRASYSSTRKYRGLEPSSKVTLSPTSKGLPSELSTDELLFHCGGFLNAASGDIQSPRESGRQSRHFRCTWNITVDNQWVILVNFSHFNLDIVPAIGGQCDERFDHVKVVDGEANNPESVRIFCGSKTPGIFLSTTNTLTIAFISYFGYGDGFRAHYNSINPERKFDSLIPLPTTVSEPTTPPSTSAHYRYECGGNLHSSEGDIQSPNFSEVLASSITCTWNITLNAGSNVALNFKVFNLDSMPIGSSCDIRYAHISITDGTDDVTSQKYVYCGSELPADFLSSTNSLTVAFVSGYGYWGEFSAHYALSNADGEPIDQKVLPVSSEKPISGQALTEESTLPCGGNLNTPTGMIQSPNFDNLRVSQTWSVNCRWTITVQVGMVIALEFTYFDLDSVPIANLCDDRYAHVKVLDGGNDTSPAQVFCGQDLPPRLVSSSNDLIVVFRDLYGYSGGFRAQYNMISASSISTAIPILPTLAQRLLTPVNTERLPSCGSVLSGSSGIFSTPEYPDLYPADTFCSWNISTADHSHFIALKFLDFDVDSPMQQEDCPVQYSYVKINFRPDNGTDESRLLCGSILPEIIAVRSQQVTVEFYSNFGFGRGFQAAYLMYDPTRNASEKVWPSFRLAPEIGATTPPLTAASSVNKGASVLTAQSGVIKSPNYPGQFPLESHNIWIVRSNQEKFISLVFVDVDFDVMTDDGVCNPLYTHVLLTMYSIDGRSSEEIVCRNVTAVFSYGQLELEFLSSYGIGRGFRAHYSTGFHYVGEGSAGSQEIPILTPSDVSAPPTLSEAITPVNLQEDRISPWCRYVFVESRGQFSSPNYPSVYPANTVCRWTMLAPAEQHVRIDFHQFQLDSEDSSPCDEKQSHIVIKTSNPSGDEEKMFCGKTIPHPIASPSNQLVVTFRSRARPDIGFLAEYQFIEEDAYQGSFGAVTAAVKNTILTKEGMNVEITATLSFPEAEMTTLALEDPTINVPTPSEVHIAEIEQVSEESGISSSSSTVLNASASATDQRSEESGISSSSSTVLNASASATDQRSEESGISSSSSTVLNASASATDQSARDFRFLGGEGITDQSEDGRGDLMLPTRRRVNVPVSQPQEPETITTRKDLEAEEMATSKLEINDLSSSTLPGYTSLPEVTVMESTDSGKFDLFSVHQLKITTYVCIGVAVALFVVLVLLTAGCIYKRRQHHVSKSVDMGRTEKSYWQNYKSWARDYTGAPRSAPSGPGNLGEADEEGEEAEGMLNQERLV